MKALIAFLSLVTMGLAADTPSLAGKVYRETGSIPSIRRTWEKTVAFTSENRFFYVLYSEAFTATSGTGAQVFLQPPRSDGSYKFRVDGGKQLVDLTFDDGRASETLTLNPSANIPAGQVATSGAFLSDATTGQSSSASNISLRGRVSEGRPLIAGLVIPGTPRTDNQYIPPEGTKLREVLIRVVGPSLAQFGVTGAWADPAFKLYQGNTPAPTNEVYYTNWSTVPNGWLNGAPMFYSPSPDTEAAFRKIFTYTGAFPLTPGSKDACMIVRLSPGAYTIVAEPLAGDTGGEALIEAYFLP